MVDLLFVEDEDTLRSARDREDALRPGLRHRRDALRRRGLPARAEPGRAARGVRAGAERRDVRDLPLGHDAQGPGRVAHRPAATRSPTTATRARTFDYMLANPPFGVEWKQVEKVVRDEHETRGFGGRFGAGLPRINDGSFLFLQHMLSKMKPPSRAARGSRSSSTARRSSPAPPARASRRSAAGSSRTTGSRPSSRFPTSSSTTPASRPTSGSSRTARARATRQGAARRCPRLVGEDAQEPRREAQAALPTSRSASSSSSTARSTEGERVKIFRNERFGFQRITVERPLRLRCTGDGLRERLEASRGWPKLDDADASRSADCRHRRGARRALDYRPRPCGERT